MKLISKLFKSLKQVPESIWLVLLYLLVHLPSLTLLPVFADEAIYIRWAQLIQDDAGRYLFFSMADGKPPLFMWLLSLELNLFHDPLLAGRLLAVAIGLITVFVIRALMSELSNDPIARLGAAVITIFLPFWFFYHRMVLMDGLLTVLVALAFLFALRLSKLVIERRTASQRQNLRTKIIGNLLGLVVSFGLAMMTKTPALMTIPAIAMAPVYIWFSAGKKSKSVLIKSLTYVGLGGFLGCLLFLLLRISPLFGALFTRSTDFTFSLQNLLAGEWRYVIGKSLPQNLGWIISYVTPELFLISLFGLFSKKWRSITIFMFLCAISFLAPLTLVGRVLWPRYFLPAIIFLTLAMAMGIASTLRKKTIGIICVILIGLASIRTAYFIGASYFSVASTPFVNADKLQYLTQWSAGYGNSEVRDFVIRQQSLLPKDGSKKIIILTEGSFGTLPDGLLMYFHDHNADGLEIHGIGVSVATIPSIYLQMAKTNDVYYMLNSDRFGLVDKSLLTKVFEVKRPEFQIDGKSSTSLLFFKVNTK